MGIYYIFHFCVHSFSFFFFFCFILGPHPMACGGCSWFSTQGSLPRVLRGHVMEGVKVRLSLHAEPGPSHWVLSNPSLHFLKEYFSFSFKFKFWSLMGWKMKEILVVCTCQKVLKCSPSQACRRPKPKQRQLASYFPSPRISEASSWKFESNTNHL